MKIGILGTRGIPNAYGGFEQCAQYLAEGLEKKGHEVWVYNSSDHPYAGKKWNNINIIHCKDPESKIGSVGQFIYDFNCLRDARKRNYDILLQLGYTSNSLWHFIWPTKTSNIINMDGLEWKRSKYNRITQSFLKRAEKWAVDHGDMLIADSIAIQNYLQQKYNKSSVYIPYGAVIFENPAVDVLAEWELEAKKYFLVIARMEPENNIEMIIEGFIRSKKPFPLVIIGNTNNKYGQYLHNKYKHQLIVFTEGIYDQEKINNIRFFSTRYFHGHSVGGTNPSLLEAMACSCNIVAHDNPFNKAILTDYAQYFNNADDISTIVNEAAIENYSNENISRNIEKIKTQFDWKKVIDAYEQAFLHAKRY